MNFPIMLSKVVGFIVIDAVAAGDVKPVPNYAMMFDNFKQKYGKSYNGVDEETKRFDIFKSNVDLIYDTNAKKLSYTLGVNAFADLTGDEFAEMYGVHCNT